MAETIELIIQAKDQLSWTSLTEWLDTLDLPYVSGCLVTHDDEVADVHKFLENESWSDLSGWPVSLYFESESSVNDFVESLWEWLERYQLRDLFKIEVQKIPNQIWQKAWDAEIVSYETTRFVIQILGTHPLPSAMPEIVIDPGLAFGSGQHATTKASLLMLESLPVEDSLMDVGTGTGILAIAAEKLGYQRVVATDIDPDAWLSAEKNRKLNQARFTLVKDSLPKAKESFKVIVCNILPPVVNQLMPELTKMLTPGGALVIAGVHQANARMVLESAFQLKLNLEREVDERGWLALCFRSLLGD